MSEELSTCVTPTPNSVKRPLEREIAERLKWERKKEGIESAGIGSCVLATYIALDVLRRERVPAVPQAGTACWPWRKDWQELPATEGTHFGYEWSPYTPQSRMMKSLGGNPELHAWVAIPETQEIVDFSTPYLPEVCKVTAGLDWELPRPEVVWTQSLPIGYFYMPEEAPTGHVIAQIIKFRKPKYFTPAEFALAGMESR